MRDYTASFVITVMLILTDKSYADSYGTTEEIIDTLAVLWAFLTCSTAPVKTGCCWRIKSRPWVLQSQNLMLHCGECSDHEWLLTGSLSVDRDLYDSRHCLSPADGHWSSEHLWNGEEDTITACLQHPDGRPVHLLPHGTPWICGDEWTTSQSCWRGCRTQWQR